MVVVFLTLKILKETAHRHNPHLHICERLVIYYWNYIGASTDFFLLFVKGRDLKVGAYLVQTKQEEKEETKEINTVAFITHSFQSVQRHVSDSNSCIAHFSTRGQNCIQEFGHKPDGVKVKVTKICVCSMRFCWIASCDGNRLS